MASPIKNFIKNDNAQIYHEVYGDDKAPTFLLSHAYGASSAMWAKQIDAFSKNHRIILWDMRGHGKTKTKETPEYFSHALALSDMNALLEHYQISQAVIGGLSLGGYLSLLFYQRHAQKVKALLLCDTGPGFKKDESRDQWNQRALRQAEALEKRGLGAAPKVPDGVHHHSAIGLALAARYLLTQNDASVITQLEQIQVPTIIVVGADDKPFHPSANYMDKKIPHSEKIIIPNAEHFANDDNPETFNNAVLDAFEDMT